MLTTSGIISKMFIYMAMIRYFWRKEVSGAFVTDRFEDEKTARGANTRSGNAGRMWSISAILSRIRPR